MPLDTDSELRLAAGASVQLAGAVNYVEGQAESTPDVVRVQVGNIAGSASKVALGALSLSLGSFTVDQTELAELHLANLVPQQLVVKIPSAEATDVRLGFPVTA